MEYIDKLMISFEQANMASALFGLSIYVGGSKKQVCTYSWRTCISGSLFKDEVFLTTLKSDQISFHVV